MNTLITPLENPMTINLFLLVAAITAAFCGASYARLKRARSDLSDVLTRIDLLTRSVRSETGRLVLIVGGLVFLAWVLIQGGDV